jgi:hypothetical protein
LSDLGLEKISRFAPASYAAFFSDSTSNATRSDTSKRRVVMPAMEAGVSNHVWSIEEIVGLLSAADKKAA